MGRTTRINEELGHLRSELRRSPEGEPRKPVETREPGTEHSESTPSALDQQLRELGETLSTCADDAEELVAKYPLVAVGVALMLGIALGRLFGRDQS